MNDLIIIGASGFGKEVAWLVERINSVSVTWNLLGFLDDNEQIQGSLVGGYNILGSTERAGDYKNAWFVCAIGAAKTRKKVITKLNEKERMKYATLVDPNVLSSQRVKIGEGSIICAHTIMTVDIEIGSHVIINLDCTIGHDAVLKDFVTLYPSVNVSGNTVIGECVELGTGMQIIQGKSVGDGSIVGAGAVVVKDIPPQCTAVGSPAKPIKFFE
jgi:sugar O-acyltransferase (sialic acid O-acetyltransferase NeuD family)